MKIIAQSLILTNLSLVAASQQSYLRRRAKAAKEVAAGNAPPDFPAAQPLLVEDAIQIAPSLSSNMMYTKTSGIVLGKSSYTTSESVTVDFTVSPQHYVNSEVKPNPSKSDEWSIGLYMHMADPQGGALPPIVSLKPEFEGRGSTKGSVTFSRNAVPSMGGTDPSWPLDTLAYGTGFDVWLLDEKGAAIIGPEWFTLETPPEEEYSSFMESSQSKLHPLAEHGHAESKQNFSSEDVAADVSSFVLSTDKAAYTSYETIRVSYTIGQQADAFGEPSESAANEDSLILFNAPPIEDEIVPADNEFISQDSTMKLQGFDASFESTDANFDADFAPQAANLSGEPSYTIGVYMKMARPQGGKLEPIISKSVTAKSGTVQFDASSLDTLSYGTGFDLWIVDEDGSEVYGPVYFSIPDPSEEESTEISTYDEHL